MTGIDFFSIGNLAFFTILTAWVGFCLKADDLYDFFFRRKSRESYGELFSNGKLDFKFDTSVRLARRISDLAFCHGKQFRPKVLRTLSLSIFALSLGFYLSVSYYADTTIIHWNLFRWNSMWPFLIGVVAANFIFDFFSVWFSRIILEGMTSKLNLYLLTILDFLVSACLSPFFWLFLLAMLGLQIPVYFNSPFPYGEPTDPQISELETNRILFFFDSVRYGGLIDFLTFGDAGGHSSFGHGHMHGWHVLGGGIIIGSLLSSITTSIAVLVLHASLLIVWILMALLKPVAIASKNLGLAVERKPIGVLMLINGTIYIIVSTFLFSDGAITAFSSLSDAIAQRNTPIILDGEGFGFGIDAE